MPSVVDCVVPARGKLLIETGIKIRFPERYYATINSRSGLAHKNFVVAFPGVIDNDYRNSIKVILFNHSDVDFPVKKGDRIAQLIFHKMVD